MRHVWKSWTFFGRSATPFSFNRWTEPLKSAASIDRFCRFIGDQFLSRLPQAVDSQLHHVAHLQVGRRTHSQADPSGRSRADDVAGEKGHELADVADERRDIEDHIGRSALLPILAVLLQSHAQASRVRALIASRHRPSYRSERLRVLSLDPLAS